MNSHVWMHVKFDFTCENACEIWFHMWKCMWIQNHIYVESKCVFISHVNWHVVYISHVEWRFHTCDSPNLTRWNFTCERMWIFMWIFMWNFMWNSCGFFIRVQLKKNYFFLDIYIYKWIITFMGLPDISLWLIFHVFWHLFSSIFF